MNRLLEEKETKTQKAKTLSFLIVVAILAGFFQSFLWTTFREDYFLYIDDIFIQVAFIFSLFRVLSLPGHAVLFLMVWITINFMALLSSLFLIQSDPSSFFFLFRQVIIPAQMVFIGIALRKYEWARILKLTVALGVLSSIFIFIEWTGFYLIDPVPLAEANGIWITRIGLPGYYFNWSDTGEIILRMGGQFLNPPIAGIFTATSAVFLFNNRFQKTLFLKYSLVSLLIFATLLTWSFGGFIIIFFGIVVPFALLKIGRFASTFLSIIVLYFMFVEISSSFQGKVSHLDGLLTSFQHVFQNPIGKGFGYVGNFAGDSGLKEAGESLLGISFSATGIISLLLVLIAFVWFWNKLSKADDSDLWLYSLSIGLLSLALVAETAGALSATIPLWLGMGHIVSRTLRR